MSVKEGSLEAHRAAHVAHRISVWGRPGEAATVQVTLCAADECAGLTGVFDPQEAAGLAKQLNEAADLMENTGGIA